MKLISKKEKKIALVEKVENGVRKTLLYTVSIPERTILSGISLIVGAYESLSDVLFPKWFKKSTSYRVTLGLMSQFLQKHVTGIENPESMEGDEYVQRKTAGTVIEAVGIATFRFSPLWIFAIVSDVVGGSSVYYNRLVHHLKENKIIDDNYSGQDVTALLSALQQTTDHAASIIDMPPVTLEQASVTAKQLAESLSITKDQAAKMLPETEAIWTEMNRLADKGVSLEQIAGFLTIDAMNKVGEKGQGVMKSVTEASGELLNTYILESYKETLTDLSVEGHLTYFNRRMKPYVKSIGGLFNPKRDTLTQKALHWIGKNTK